MCFKLFIWRLEFQNNCKRASAFAYVNNWGWVTVKRTHNKQKGKKIKLRNMSSFWSKKRMGARVRNVCNKKITQYAQVAKQSRRGGGCTKVKIFKMFFFLLSWMVWSKMTRFHIIHFTSFLSVALPENNRTDYANGVSHASISLYLTITPVRLKFHFISEKSVAVYLAPGTKRIAMLIIYTAFVLW